MKFDNHEPVQRIIEYIIRISQKYNHLEKTPQSFGPLKIYPSQAYMLCAIHKLERVNITELARRLQITKASVVETIDKLQQKKLVVRSKNPDNDKEVYVELSRTGKEISVQIMEHHGTLIRDLTASIRIEKGIEYTKVCTMLSHIEDFFDTYMASTLSSSGEIPHIHSIISD